MLQPHHQSSVLRNPSFEMGRNPHLNSTFFGLSHALNTMHLPNISILLRRKNGEKISKFHEMVPISDNRGFIRGLGSVDFLFEGFLGAF